MLQRQLRSWRRENHLNRIEAVMVLGYYGLKTTIHALRRWECGTIPFKRNLKKLERILEAHPIVDYKRLLPQIIEKDAKLGVGGSSALDEYRSIVKANAKISGYHPIPMYENNTVTSPIHPNLCAPKESERMTFAEDMQYRYNWHKLPT
jgi:hypothetical protein